MTDVIIDLFTPRVPTTSLHPIFAMLLQERYAPERAVLQSWTQGFRDRDGKFVQEFQTTFESGLWELYLHAVWACLGLEIDWSFHAPDFVIKNPSALLIEATIAAPPTGAKPAFGYDFSDIPNDFNQFNNDAAVRICNSFDSKIKRYRDYYSTLPHAIGKPYVIAIGAFDRPLAHMAASRPIIAAIYGLYHDEEAAIKNNARRVVGYNVDVVTKNESIDIPVGLFCTDQYPEVSAVIYSSLATWGKVRAMADNPTARTIYTTTHPNANGLPPTFRQTLKKDYREHLLDGLYILHNPFAERPIDAAILNHARIAQINVAYDGELLITAPDDFLLIRTLMSFQRRTKDGGII